MLEIHNIYFMKKDFTEKQAKDWIIAHNYNNYYIMDKLKNKSLSLGASEFGISKTKNKRFYVIYNNKKINFGSTTNNTFIDHGDQDKRRAWFSRHSNIKNKNGELVYKLKSSPDYWSYNILWT
jgi:hypothetical protein